MNMQTLEAQLGVLASGRQLRVSRADCEALFPPGLRSAAGRQDMYTLANTKGCDVQWDDDAVVFVKR